MSQQESCPLCGKPLGPVGGLEADFFEAGFETIVSQIAPCETEGCPVIGVSETGGYWHDGPEQEEGWWLCGPKEKASCDV